jgi:hypothetical protein
VIALDDELARNKRMIYAEVRNADPDGQVVAGLRYVRNALGHSLLTVTESEGGLRFPISFPLSIGPIVTRWKSAEDVRVNMPQERNRRYYSEWVAGRVVEETRVAAHRWHSRQIDCLKAETGLIF